MISVAETNGLRRFRKPQSPPCSTPSGVVSARLRRCLEKRFLFMAASAGKPSVHRFPSNISNTAKRYHLSTELTQSCDQSRVLRKLFSAVQSQNPMQIIVEIKALASHEHPNEVMEALKSLPTAAFSELVRSLDPFRVGPRADLSHGIHLSNGLRHFSPVSSLMNQFGIRKLYCNSLHLIRAVLDLRLQNGRQLALSDYIVLLRCAGAASDIDTAKWIWKAAMKADLEKNSMVRGGLAYAEFMKARFLTEPLYMQNDLARFRVRPRDLSGHRKCFANKRSLFRLERLRLSIFANNSSFYGRAPDQPTHELHRKVSLHQPVRRIWENILRSNIDIDHELLSAYLVACGRAGSVRELIRQIWQIWRVRLTDLKDHRAAEIIGGLGQDRIDPVKRPNLRILNAILHAFSCTGHVILARKLLFFFSVRYDIPIPPETWSSLLEWTYVMSSKPASTEWKIMRDRNRIIKSEELFTVWNIMTSELKKCSPPVEPSFKDMDMYVKSLIMAGKLDVAWNEIRHGRTLYETICKEVETALFERLYPLPPKEVVARHLKAKVRQHTTWFTIEKWCKMWLEKGSKLYRSKDAFSQQIIPEFIAEFKGFLPNPATYKTSGGTVRIETPQNVMRQWWTQHIVRSPPTELRVPDRARPKFTTLNPIDEVKYKHGEQRSEAQDPLLIPVVTEKGSPLYEMQTIALNRWTKKLVTKRVNRIFGENEKKLDWLYMDEANEEGLAPAINEETRRIQKSGYKHRLVLRSLIW